MTEKAKEPDQTGQQVSSMTVLDTLALAHFDDKQSSSQVISEKGNIRVVLFSFKAGQRLHDHHTPYRILIQSLQGSLFFSTSDSTRVLHPGMLLWLDAHVIHSVVAETDVVMLLTIFKIDDNVKEKNNE